MYYTVDLILIQMNSLHAGFFFMLFCVLLTFFKISLFQIIISVSNSLDPDQAQCSSRPDLGPNCKDHQQMTKFAAGSLSLGF